MAVVVPLIMGEAGVNVSVGPGGGHGQGQLAAESSGVLSDIKLTNSHENGPTLGWLGLGSVSLKYENVNVAVTEGSCGDAGSE